MRAENDRLVNAGPKGALSIGAKAHMAGEWRRAEAIYRQILDIWPDHSDAWDKLGILLRSVGRLDEAVGAFERAIDIEPRQHKSIYNLGLMKLSFGEFEEGWRLSEHRPEITNLATTNPPLFETAWHGEPLEGRSVLLWAEQGFGDMFQFVRYVSKVAELGGQVYLDTHPKLKRILRSVPGAERAIARGEPLPAFDFSASVLSLPHLLGLTTLEQLAVAVPYLRAEPPLVQAWSRRLADTQVFKVGIAWAGRSTHPQNRQRSIPLKTLYPLFSVPGVRFYSLQVGDEAGVGPDALAAVDNVADIAGDLADFADTAAAMVNLDLVISVDTAIVHLAGALGRPVWVLLPAAADWRWLTEGDRTHWYPSARLFRQAKIDDWDEVIRRVARELAMIAGKSNT